MLADAAKRGVRLVVETHSSLLLLGVQTLVAEGDLSPELVKLHWFSRNKDGITEVTSAELDEVGAYGDWPEDFDDVDLKTQSRYHKSSADQRFRSAKRRHSMRARGLKRLVIECRRLPVPAGGEKATASVSINVHRALS